MMNKTFIKERMQTYCKVKYGRLLDKAEDFEVWNCLSMALLEGIVDDWQGSTEVYQKHKMAYYISAEYLMGRALGNNLISLKLYDEVKELLEEMHIDINKIEEIEEDAGLGNGGLGRLAACFMDSGATMHLPLQGYGIRYSNGLFKQKIIDGAQFEEADEWLKYGDPWSIRRDDLAVIVNFANEVVRAVPYDTPIIGYGSKNINTLRLWKSEALQDFDFNLYNVGKYTEALQSRNRIEDISRILYPNDSSDEGKKLRLRQQYFMVSASLQDIIRSHKALHGNTYDNFGEWHAIQLNDTHPVLAIPELIRILVDEEGMAFDEAIAISKNVFGYTNHTILQEALERWDAKFMETLFPRILEIIEQIDEAFVKELQEQGHTEEAIKHFKIISEGVVYMANLAIHIGKAVNGVAALHTEILKNKELHNWYELYPWKFQNKTNGITPRRWLCLANKELAAYITSLLGDEEWICDLSQLKKLEAYRDDEKVLKEIMAIKHKKKVQLADYIKTVEKEEIDPNSIFDIQIKRLHEYKRQLLNAFYILDLYYRAKEDPTLDIPKITFIFGAKAFPGYVRAKAIVKFIGELAKLINNDKDVNDKIKVIFVENYKVSYAEKLFPAADVSKQISTAGKEASGTGNMKFMLNGAPTFGTYDGANVEIVQESKEENNFIFGLRVEDIEELQNKYDSKEYYLNNPSITRILDSLIDGTFNDGGTGEFKELYRGIIEEGDSYFLLADFEAFKMAEEKVFAAYKDEKKWAQMCLMNIANSGAFSSDRTIMQYAKEIWHINQATV